MNPLWVIKIRNVSSPKDWSELLLKRFEAAFVGPNRSEVFGYLSFVKWTKNASVVEEPHEVEDAQARAAPKKREKQLEAPARLSATAVCADC